MNQKDEQTIYHANVNVDLMEENVTQINKGILITVEVKKLTYVKNILFGILLHVIVKI